jgi:hypothetical protein
VEMSAAHEKMSAAHEKMSAPCLEMLAAYEETELNKNELK